jgi:hypothetical protein
MKTITVRGIDSQLENKLKDSAKNDSISINQFILRSLRSVLGLEKEQKYTKKHNDLDFLFGEWSDEDYSSFEDGQKVFQKIDREMWK